MKLCMILASVFLSLVVTPSAGHTPSPGGDEEKIPIVEIKKDADPVFYSTGAGTRCTQADPVDSQIVATVLDNGGFMFGGFTYQGKKVGQTKVTWEAKWHGKTYNGAIIVKVNP